MEQSCGECSSVRSWWYAVPGRIHWNLLEILKLFEPSESSEPPELPKSSELLEYFGTFRVFRALELAKFSEPLDSLDSEVQNIVFSVCSTYPENIEISRVSP